RNEIASYQPYNRHLCQLAVGNRRLGIQPHPALLDHCHLVVGNTSLWLYGIGWAVLAVVVGFFVFWRAEGTYRRGWTDGLTDRGGGWSSHRLPGLWLAGPQGGRRGRRSL